MTTDDAAKLILAGDIVAFPTETVYGLGADATNPVAIKKIFNTKGRPADNPLIVHISDAEQLEYIVADIPEPAKKLMNTFWPGPLTLVFNKQQSVPDLVTAGLSTVAVRMPSHTVALELIRKSKPLVAPSANKSGRPSPTRASHVIADYGTVVPVLDGGPCVFGIESTVLDVTSEPYTILRPGSVSAEELKSVCNIEVVFSMNKGGANVKSPGIKYSHYKPDAKVVWFSGDEAGKVLRISHSENSTDKEHHISFAGDFNVMASMLYDLFRTADSKGYDVIAIDTLPPDVKHPIIIALKNRIEKAVDKKDV
jgi:L-threonylcarbamoyladenylate synthase